MWAFSQFKKLIRRAQAASGKAGDKNERPDAILAEVPFEGQPCRFCGSKKIRPVILVEQEGFPPEHESHSIGYSHIAVFECKQCGRGQVENRHHDCFDWEDVWDQYEWYGLDSTDLQQLRTIVGSCPQPLSPYCTCPIHAALRSTCNALPLSSWEWALEADAHFHHVSLEIRKGLPTLRVKT